MTQLSTDEAAALLSVRLHTVHRPIFTRGLPATETDRGCWTVEESALPEWMEANGEVLQTLPISSNQLYPHRSTSLQAQRMPA
jgi:excisionase family DNA binding protein